MGAEQILMKEYKKLEKEPWTHIELVNDNILEWTVALIVLNPDSLYYGGYFKALMRFPTEYPFKPPDFKFIRPLYHPNIYEDGRLCISILHPPGDDEMSGELASERWSPVQNVESVLISILSLLDDAEVSSPANIEASKDLRNNPENYKRMVKRDMEAAMSDIPPGFVMPTHEDAFRQKKEEDYSMSWEDSDAEEDWGGSDSEIEDIDGDSHSPSDNDDDDDEDDEIDLDNGNEHDEP